MDIAFTANDSVKAQEMQALAESVGFGPHRSPERNRRALAGSMFVASARCKGKLVGLVRLVGDGAYVLHMADLEVRPDFQKRGVGRRLMEMAMDFAREKKIGTGHELGEFTLFANAGAGRFYEELGFVSTPNGMVLADTEARRADEMKFRKEWRQAARRRAGRK